MRKTEGLLPALAQRILIADGAMGTCLAGAGLAPEDYGGHPHCPEILNLTRPEIVASIHRRYLEAGADIIETNSFGGAAHILAEHGLDRKCRDINRKAAQLAREAADEFSRSGRFRFVAGSMGPGSKLPSLGQITFDQLMQSYRLQAEGLLEGGVDCLIIETSQDLLQIKAALAAVRDLSSEIPVMAQVTLDSTGRTLTGSDIGAVLASLEPLSLAAIGLNCGTGPEGMAGPLAYLSQHCSKPVSVMPNAGLPKVSRGRVSYDLAPEDFAQQMAAYVERLGLNIAGGCCGTTPEHIAALARRIRKFKPRRLPGKVSGASSLYQWQPLRVSLRPLIIGERTNATGSRSFRELLEKGDFPGLVSAALAQEREGAHLIDLSLALPGRDEAADMDRAGLLFNTALKIPVMIDSTDPRVVEAGLKRLAGRCVVNSFNLENRGRRAERILSLCRAYGAAAVGLAIDDRGMAMSASRKLELAERLISLARRYGLAEGDVFIDFLTFSLASGNGSLAGAGAETLRALAEFKKRHPGYLTVLGVSNISHGLPPAVRQALNSVFLHQALQHGLDAAIMHAGRVVPLDVLDKQVADICRCVIYHKDYHGRRPLELLLERLEQKIKRPSFKDTEEKDPQAGLFQAVIDGDGSRAAKWISELLRTQVSPRLLTRRLIEAMEEVGRRFQSGRMQLPYVLRSAEAMKMAARKLAPHLGAGGMGHRGTMVIATVRGDIHDIGKDLVDMILSANGYRVINLGVRQTPEDILRAVKKYRPNAVGLSGLLVESARAMKEYLEVLNHAGLKVPVICGGAALSKKFVLRELSSAYRGRVFYAADAMEGLRLMNKICSGAGGGS